MLHEAMRGSRLYCTVLYSTVYCTVLYSTVYCTVLYSTVYCTVLYSTVYCTVLYRPWLCRRAVPWLGSSQHAEKRAENRAERRKRRESEERAGGEGKQSSVPEWLARGAWLTSWTSGQQAENQNHGQ